MDNTQREGWRATLHVLIDRMFDDPVDEASIHYECGLKKEVLTLTLNRGEIFDLLLRDLRNTTDSEFEDALMGQGTGEPVGIIASQ